MNNEKVIGGLCAHIGDYFECDAFIIRLIVVLLFLYAPVTTTIFYCIASLLT